MFGRSPGLVTRSLPTRGSSFGDSAMAYLVWVNAEVFERSNRGRTLEQIRKEFRDAVIAAHEGRVMDLPDWMALSIDEEPSTGEPTQ